MLRKFLFLLLLFPAVAVAADRPNKGVQYYNAPQSFNWNGNYIGLGAGHTANSSAVAPGIVGIENDSWFVTGYVGHNIHYATGWLLGIEGDFSYSDQNGSAFGGIVTHEVPWSATARGRIGYAFDRWLVYGTGGVAFARGEAAVGPFSAKANHIGWVGGAGLEYALTNAILVRGQWLYHDLGSENYNFGPGSVNGELSWHSFSLGAALKF